MARRGVLLGLFLLFGGCAAPPAAERLALVVGSSSYRTAPPLRNPAHDAEAVAGALTRLGWSVTTRLDPTRAQLDAAQREFVARLANAEAAVFFYAGHAIQLDGQNYLVPVDADLDTDDLGSQLCGLDPILGSLARARTTIVFLDACRTNPWADELARNIASGRTVRVASGRGIQVLPRGLAKVSSQVGTLIAFATSPGQIAADGAGDHSPFSAALLEHLETPGLEVTELLRRVRASVQTATDARQLPWDTSALVAPFYFSARSVSRPPPP